MSSSKGLRSPIDVNSDHAFSHRVQFHSMGKTGSGGEGGGDCNSGLTYKSQGDTV